MTDCLPDLVSLVPHWQRAMKSEHKSTKTITTYTAGVDAFLRWCERTDTAAVITKPNAQGWIADLLDNGAQPTTATTWLGGLKRFAAWLADEDEIPTNPLVRVTSPKLDTKVVSALTDDELTLLIKQCAGKKFIDRRDEAIVRLMVETTMRANELVELRCDDLDLARGLVVIRRGKGGKGRTAPFGPTAATALDRYMRLRSRHVQLGKIHTDNPQLFVGGGQRTSFSYSGLARTLRARAKSAGIAGFHVHKLRHTAASRWLRAGGSEGGLMAVAGWTNRQMLDRYVRSTASERAAAEARRLNLGDF
jgi:integrase/recombinase XerD